MALRIIFQKKAIFFKIRFNPLKVSQIFTVHVGCLFGGFVEGGQRRNWKASVGGAPSRCCGAARQHCDLMLKYAGPLSLYCIFLFFTSGNFQVKRS